MKSELYEITFDFSSYFGKEIIFKEYCSPKDSIKYIIENSNNLNNELKIQLENKPPIYKANDRQIMDLLSLENNEIKNGNIIVARKKIKKQKLRSIKNKYKYKYEENNIPTEKVVIKYNIRKENNHKNVHFKCLVEILISAFFIILIMLVLA